jgi:hypothetical protein
MAAVYSDYTRDRVGLFFGLTGIQLALVVAGGLPVVWAMNRERWSLLILLMLSWAVWIVLVTIPIRGRSATGWLLAILALAVGTLLGWTSWRSRASRGRAAKVAEPDLPGVVSGIRVHDGPPQGVTNTRVAIIQDQAARTWAVTAALEHPGLALANHADRDAMGAGLTDLLNACARTELISEVAFLVRSVPDDGAERERWMAAHDRPDAPMLSRIVNAELSASLSKASIRTEAFVTLVAPEARLAKEAKEFGGGVDGRARVMHMLMGEVSSHLLSGMRAVSVDWLTSPQLAAAVRTAFAPGDRAGIVQALAARESEPGVNAAVPWSQAGPVGASLAARHYRHDAWWSIASTLQLPAKGAQMGALAPVLRPTEPGERRSLVVVYPIVPATVADRQTMSGEWKADMAETLRAKAKIKPRAKDRVDIAQTRSLDARLATGNALVRPYAVACVTVPLAVDIAEYGRRLDSSIRRAGFAPLRLDPVQDAGFAAANLPLGVGLDRGGRP